MWYLWAKLFLALMLRPGDLRLGEGRKSGREGLKVTYEGKPLPPVPHAAISLPSHISRPLSAAARVLPLPPTHVGLHLHLLSDCEGIYPPTCVTCE